MAIETRPQHQSTPQPTTRRSKVAVLLTRPETVVEDYGRLLDMAGYQSALPRTAPTILKVNVSWQHWYPACSTTPWQIEGVAKKLIADGYKDLIAAHNSTVVVSARKGEVANKHRPVQDRYGLQTVHLEDVKWVRYQPKGKMLVLDKVFPDGIHIPEMFMSKNVIQLPTVKTHVFTTTTGAMKNAFGGLLSHQRHWTHSVIHETLCDLLTIQKEVHPGIFAVMDGTLAGDGPGPRAMRFHVKNVILASDDFVAIDAVGAKIMGFDPLSLKYIRLGHEMGLGVGDPRQIDIVGEDISGWNWRFIGKAETFASRGQKLIYWGPLKPFERLLLRTPIVPWAYIASRLYYDGFWMNLIGRRRVKQALKTPWGKLFQGY
ncbi:MAG: DUF362 domain-containing protein [Chloroflexi bacterium]|nr:DUF362 domain-containing protein [Chloroflexota bacterium]